MSKIHSIFHKLKSIVGYSIALVVIVSALGVSGLRFLLTTANLYQDEVEQLASSILHQPVKIGRMDAKLSGLVPTLIFHNVELLSKETKKPLFSLTRIDVGLQFDDLLWQQKITPTQITIRGMDLHVTRTVEGNFKVKGFDLEALGKISVSGSSSLFEQWLLRQGEIGLEDSTIFWKDEQNAGLTWFFADVNFLLKKTSERQQLLLSSKLPQSLGQKIKLAIDLEGDISSPASWKIKGFVESKKINLLPLQKYFKNKHIELVDGVADLKLWFDWQEKKLNRLSGDIKLDDFAYHINKKEIVTLKRVSGVFDSNRDKNNTWNVSVDKFNYEKNKDILNESKFSLAFNYKGNVMETFYVKANHMKLGVLSKIVIDNHLLNKKNKERLNNLDLHGNVHDFYVVWKNNELNELKMEFNDFKINAWENIPNIKNLSGNVVYEQKKGNISLFSKKTIIGFPHLFRNDFNFTDFKAGIAFSNTNQGFLFDVKNLKTTNSEVEAYSSAKIWIPKDSLSPYLDLQTHVAGGDIAKVSNYLPVGIMKKYLINWLDKAFVAGKLKKGTVIFNGKLNDFPFNENQGVFSANVETSKLVFNYKDGWPKIQNAKVNGNFTGQGLKIHLLTGESENNLIFDSRAEISSFQETELQLDLSITGTTPNTISYLVNSPILPKAKKLIAAIKLLGHIDTKIKINIPLDDVTRKKNPLSYSGSATFRDASLFLLDEKIDITGATGKLLFTKNKFSSENLSANILGGKALFSVSSIANNKKIKVSTQANIVAGEILKRFDIPGAKNISGNTLFKVNMTFPMKGSKNSYPTLNLNSDLFGVKSSLPEYFYKRKKSRHNFNFTTVFTGNDKFQIGIRVDKKISAILELDSVGKRTYLRKGAVSISAKKAILPDGNILYIDGSINKITPSKWFKSFEFNKGINAKSFFVTPVIFNLDELKIVSEDGKDNEEESTALNPKKLPAFSGIIKKLYLDKAFFGQLDFKVSRKKYGLHLDELYLTSKNMKLIANGGWHYRQGKHKSDLDITLSSDDFGGMLTDLDFSAIIEHGKAQSRGKINWQSSPGQFSFNKLNGNIQLKIKNGNIKEADAGAGRLLGLFSLSALPRRLFGDFKDTFKSGYNFDTAKGEINIEDGDVYTDDFEINSPVARIMLSGRTGLSERDYENTIVVIPNISGAATTLTALLVNLPAGIGLWLFDKITGEQFNYASARTYEISGSWEKPEIELVEEEDTL